MIQDHNYFRLPEPGAKIQYRVSKGEARRRISTDTNITLASLALGTSEDEQEEEEGEKRAAFALHAGVPRSTLLRASTSTQSIYHNQQQRQRDLASLESSNSVPASSGVVRPRPGQENKRPLHKRSGGVGSRELASLLTPVDLPKLPLKLTLSQKQVGVSRPSTSSFAPRSDQEEEVVS